MSMGPSSTPSTYMPRVDAFSDFGHRVAFDDVRRQIGKGGDQLPPDFLSAEEISARGSALKVHRGYILKERYLPLMRPFLGVRTLLERVRMTVPRSPWRPPPSRMR